MLISYMLRYSHAYNLYCKALSFKIIDAYSLQAFSND